MMNFQKLQHRKLENFRGQSRLLRRHLTTKLCNLGMCSKALEVDNDASFHLRLCLVDLDEVQGRRFKCSALCQFDTPPYYRLTKKPILIRVKMHLWTDYGSKNEQIRCISQSILGHLTSLGFWPLAPKRFWKHPLFSLPLNLFYPKELRIA